MKRTLHATKVFVLNDRSDYGRLTASTFEERAKQLGLRSSATTAGTGTARATSTSCSGSRPTGADGIYIGGDMDQNGAQLLRDKVAVLGSNARVKVVVTDGFVYRSLVGEAGASTVEGIVGTSPSSPSDRLAARPAVSSTRSGTPKGTSTIYGFTIYAAAATQVLLDAIARSDGTRKDVVAKLFATTARRR